MQQPCFIGVDGGASKTTIVLIDRDENVLGEVTFGPTNHRLVGARRAAWLILQGVRRTLRRARRTDQDVFGICLGLAGMNNHSDQLTVRRNIRAVFPRIWRRRFIVVSDVHIGYAAGTTENAGVVVVAGTGSNVFARARDGQEFLAGGYGFLLSRGSGHAIAREALLAAARAAEEHGPETKLTGMILRQRRAQTVREALGHYTRPSTPVAEVAQLSLFVDRAARRGDRVARRILRSAADDLATMTAAMIQCARLRRRLFPLVLVGSVFYSHSYTTRFMRRIRASAPHVRFIELKHPSALGAAQLAMRQFGERRTGKT